MASATSMLMRACDAPTNTRTVNPGAASSFRDGGCMFSKPISTTLRANGMSICNPL